MGLKRKIKSALRKLNRGNELWLCIYSEPDKKTLAWIRRYRTRWEKAGGKFWLYPIYALHQPELKIITNITINNYHEKAI